MENTPSPDATVPIQVHVLGRDYTLRVKEENEERTRSIAESVNQRMKAFQRAHPQQANLTTAIITALAIAEELHDAQEEKDHQHEMLDHQLSELAEILAGAVDEPGTEQQRVEN